MWKCARRSLKATFRNGFQRCNTVLSTKSQKEVPVEDCLLKLAPAIVQRYSNFCNLCRNPSGNFSKDKKDGEEPKEKNWFFGVLPNDLSLFLKWGGLFALCGYLRYKFQTNSNLDHHENYSVSNRVVHHKTFGYLIDIVGLKPYNCIFPKVQATKSKKGKQEFTELGTTNFKPDEINFSGLEKGYEKILGTLNNTLGTQCMKFGQCKDAFDYFVQSAEKEYAPGIFNLGICYEKGLGTSQDIPKAAELYQRAADLGHPTAMYNLGVFYAQGKGGIEVDVNHARDLFKAAAKLEQSDAINALKLEKNGGEETIDLLSDKKQKNENTLSHFFYNELTNHSPSSSIEHYNASDKESQSSCDFYEYSREERLNSSLDSDSGVLDLSPHNEACVSLV